MSSSAVHPEKVIEEKPKKDRKDLFKYLVVIVLVFGLGILVGSDRVGIGPDALYRKSVQKSSLTGIDYTGVDELYADLKNGYDGQLDPLKIEDGIKAGLVKSAGDPYTEYFNVEESKEFKEQLNGSFEGIGAELGKENEYVIIIAPIDGFPAQKAGLKARDIVSKINDETAYDLSVSEAVKKIRGEKGTSVKLEVIRDGKPLEFEITREQINLPSVKTEITEDNIGIIKLSRFGEDTNELIIKAAQDFKAKGVKGVILDVRGDPGGLVDAAVGVSNLWLPKGKTILDEKRDGKVVKNYMANGNSILLGIPTVVLVDGGSASASEIVAGALRDNNAATIIGEKTYGKGSVQEVRELNDGGLLKVTIARWFTPAGRNIDKEGIEPDQKVTFTEDDVKAGKDPQKDAALQKLRN